MSKKRTTGRGRLFIAPPLPFELDKRRDEAKLRLAPESGEGMRQLEGGLLSSLGDAVKTAEVNIAITTREAQVVLPFSLELAQKIHELRGGKPSEAVESPKKGVSKAAAEKASPQRQEALQDIFGVCKSEFGLEPETVRLLAPLIYGENLSDIPDDKIGVVKNTMKVFKLFEPLGPEVSTGIVEQFFLKKKLSEMTGQEVASFAALVRLIEAAFTVLAEGAPDYLKSLGVNLCTEQGEIKRETDIVLESQVQS